MTVEGVGFISDSVVRVDGVSVPTTFVNIRTLKARIPASVVARALPNRFNEPGPFQLNGVYGDRTVKITVFNRPPDGGTSNSVSLRVQAKWLRGAAESDGPARSRIVPVPAFRNSCAIFSTAGVQGGVGLQRPAADFQAERLRMVDEQLKGAPSATPACSKPSTSATSLFAPESLRPEAYRDLPLPIPLRPDHLPALYRRLHDTSAGRPSHHRVLEIGTGSGYQAAVLGLLANRVRPSRLSRRLRHEHADTDRPRRLQHRGAHGQRLPWVAPALTIASWSPPRLISSALV